MKINNQTIVNRWDSVMSDICCEHLMINSKLSELENKKHYYNVENGITTEWMLREAEYWLSCYYESGHCRCDDKYDSKEGYKTWVSETGKLKRLISRLHDMDNILIVEW